MRMSSVKKPLNKLNRYELVELIFQLRKENLDLQGRCAELEERLAHSTQMLDELVQRCDAEALARIEAMLASLCAGRPAVIAGPADPSDTTGLSQTPDAPRGAHWAVDRP